jgi:hypothetical protein
MEEYLTTAELSKRIKMAPGTIRNLVWNNSFKKGVHYLKPTPGKLLFVWSEVKSWLHQSPSSQHSETDFGSQSLIQI